eukprot:scaffold119023_cov52-Attheya_sp.AAC.2
MSPPCWDENGTAGLGPSSCCWDQDDRLTLEGELDRVVIPVPITDLDNSLAVLVGLSATSVKS